MLFPNISMPSTAWSIQDNATLSGCNTVRNPFARTGKSFFHSIFFSDIFRIFCLTQTNFRPFISVLCKISSPHGIFLTFCTLQPWIRAEQIQKKGRSWDQRRYSTTKNRFHVKISHKTIINRFKITVLTGILNPTYHLKMELIKLLPGAIGYNAIVLPNLRTGFDK